MKCYDCQRGDYSLCKHYSFIGSREFGSFAEYVSVPERNAVPFADNVSFEQGAFFEPATVALHGLLRLNYQGGGCVAVLGGGTIGMMTLQWAKIFGAKKVVVFDIVEERLALGKRLGADAGINTLEEGFMDRAMELTGGRGFDYVYETAGNTITMKMAFRLAANKAGVCFIGTPTKELSFTVDEWEGAEVAGAREYLQNEVRKQFPDIYADVFQVADKSASSLDAISAVINYSKKVFGNTANMGALKSLAKSKGVKKFSIHWRNDNGVQAKDPFTVVLYDDSEAPAQVVFCSESGTLYFVKTTPLSEGETWDGHTITSVWSGKKIGYQSTTVNNLATRVVIDKSFAEVRPKSMTEWFVGIKAETIEGSKVTNVLGMFWRCTSLTTIYSSQGWDISSSASMFSGCDNLKGAVDFDAGKTNGSMANPYTGYFTMPEHDTEVNVYIKDAQANTDLLKQYVDQWVNIRYSRSLQAKVGSDGDYTPTPYTVCLPYELDLSAAISSKQCAVYTLAAVTGGEFVFKKVSKTTLAAGTPYVVMVNRGKISLSAKGVKIVTAEPGSSKVYTSVADWQKGSGKSIGNWMGTFDQWDSDEAVAWDAFALKPSNNMWDYFSATGTGSIPAFRAFLSSSSIEQKEYKARYEDW